MRFLICAAAAAAAATLGLAASDTSAIAGASARAGGSWQVAQSAPPNAANTDDDKDAKKKKKKKDAKDNSGGKGSGKGVKNRDARDNGKKSDKSADKDNGKTPDRSADRKGHNKGRKQDTSVEKKPDTGSKKSDNDRKADSDKKGDSGPVYKPPVVIGPGGFYSGGIKPSGQGTTVSPYKKPARRDADKKKPPEDKSKREAREREQFEDMKKHRRKHVEEGGKRTVIEEPDKRRIYRENGHVYIRHDEEERFRRLNVETRRERHRDGNNVLIVISPGGTRVFTEEDRWGRPLRRWRRYPDGREVVLYDNRSYYRRYHGDPSYSDAVVVLPPPRLTIPRERYIVEYDTASDDDLYDTLMAPPVDDLGRTYSLEEIRQSRYLRDRMRRIDLDTITFDFGSWDVEEEDYPRLERMARAMLRILDRNPDEMFMIEGYTDAVGDEEDNLTLSDRRAESVAVILSEEFGVPPENLTTQGYGEQFLKIDTDGPERLNRRVAVRRITPLLSRDFRDQ